MLCWTRYHGSYHYRTAYGEIVSKNDEVGTAMKLIVGSQSVFSELTPEVIEREIRALTTDVDSFAILERTASAYVQIARVEADAYYIDFRDDEGPNFFLERQPVETVISILKDVLKGDDSWRYVYQWQPVNDGAYSVVQDYSEEELDRALAEAEQREQKRLEQCEATIAAPSLITGYIRHYGLVDWWISAFTDAEKRQIFEAEGAYNAQSGAVTEIVFFEEALDIGQQRVRDEYEQSQPGLVLGNVVQDDRQEPKIKLEHFMGSRPDGKWETR
jgi:hypothetical protein